LNKRNTKEEKKSLNKRKEMNKRNETNVYFFRSCSLNPVLHLYFIPHGRVMPALLLHAIILQGAVITFFLAETGKCILTHQIIILKEKVYIDSISASL